MNLKKITFFFKKVNFIIGSEKTKIFYLLPLNLISSLMELLGIGLFVILISTLQEARKLIEISSYIPFLNTYANMQDVSILILLLSLLIFVIYLIKTILSLYVNYITLKITFMFGAKLRSFLMRLYQTQRYEKFIKKNTSDYIYNIQTLVGQFISYALLPVLKIVADAFISICIIIYLFFNNPYVLIGLLTLSIIIGIAFDLIFKSRMTLYGEQQNKTSTKLIKSISEGLNGYKEIHIFGVLNYFYKNLNYNANKLANLKINSLFITSLPRILLEISVIAAVLLLISTTVFFGKDKSELISTLVLFVLASARLLPAINQMISNFSRLRFGRDALNLLYEEIIKKTNQVKIEDEENIFKNIKTKTYQDNKFKKLKFKNVFFKYKPEGEWILKSLNFEINCNDIIGIIGASGGGKTTIVDLMLGFIKPNKGTIEYNEKNIKNKKVLNQFNSNISYLPQDIFLIDDTLTANIALGIEKNNIDQAKVLTSIKKARLDKLIKDLPDGVDSRIGERGVLLSGGQKQRIAIARAFYFNSKFLIMDESTNALDTKTTNNIISELRLLKGNITIVLITHHDALLDICNKVYDLVDGKLQKN